MMFSLMFFTDLKIVLYLAPSANIFININLSSYYPYEVSVPAVHNWRLKCLLIICKIAQVQILQALFPSLFISS